MNVVYVKNSSICEEIREPAFDNISNLTYGLTTLQCDVGENTTLDIEQEFYERRLRNEDIAVIIECASLESSNVIVPLYSCVSNLVYLRMNWCRVKERADQPCLWQNEAANNDNQTSGEVSKVQVLHFIDIDFVSNVSCGNMPELRVLTVISSRCDYCEYEDMQCFAFVNLSQTLQYATFYDIYWFTADFIRDIDQSIFPFLLLLNVSSSALLVDPDVYSRLNPIWHIGRFFPAIRTIDIGNAVLSYHISLFQDHRPFVSPVVIVHVHNMQSLFLSLNDIAVIKKLNNVFFDIQIESKYFNCARTEQQVRDSIRRDEIFQPSGKYGYFASLNCTVDKKDGSQPYYGRLVDYSLYQKNYTSFIIIITSVLAIVLLFTIIGIIFYKQELRIISFNTRKKFFHAADNISVHVLIIYDLVDQDFVDCLAQRLKQMGGFKLTLPERDFVPGDTLVDDIDKAIESNHYTVFVCSTSSVQNEWCVYMFQKAYERMVKERFDYLLLILLDDISHVNETCQQLQESAADRNYLIDVCWLAKNCVTLRRDNCLFWYALNYRLNASEKNLRINFV